MKPLPMVLCAFAAAALLAACSDDGDGGNGNTTNGGQLTVVTTVAPITSLTENIGGTKIELEGIVPEGTNSHTYEPPPSVVSTLADADLIILNGLQLDEPTLDLAETNNRDDAVILQLGDETITSEEYKYDFSFPESGGKPK